MKFAVLAISLVSTAAVAASNPPSHVDNRTRDISTTVTGLSDCSEAQVETSSYQAPATNSEGQILVDGNGATITKKMETISAKSTLQVQSCKVTEAYQVTVTGSWYNWSPKEEEIAGSQKRSQKLSEDTQEYKESQDFDLKKLFEAANPGTIFSNDGDVVELIDTLKAGIAKKAKDKCEEALKQQASQKQALSTTACAAQ